MARTGIPRASGQAIKEAITRHLAELDAHGPEELVEERLARYRKLGAVAVAGDSVTAAGCGQQLRWARNRMRQFDAQGSERVDKLGQNERRIGVLTSGGDAPGMNAADPGRGAHRLGARRRGSRRREGFQGLINREFIRVTSRVRRGHHSSRRNHFEKRPVRSF